MTGLAEIRTAQHPTHGGDGLVLALRQNHALARRQAVGLSIDGRQVPLLMAENGAGVFFYGEAPRSLFSSHRWYWLNGLPNLAPALLDGGSPALPGTLAHRARLEAGEDPEKLEEQFGEMDGGEEGAGDALFSQFMKKIRGGGKQPQRDPKLYEMADYVS